MDIVNYLIKFLLKKYEKYIGIEKLLNILNLDRDWSKLLNINM